MSNRGESVGKKKRGNFRGGSLQIIADLREKKSVYLLFDLVIRACATVSPEL